MTEAFLFILTTVIVVVSIIWHRQISLAFLQVIAGRRIKRPFMSAETLEEIEIECKIIEDPRPYAKGGVVRGPQPIPKSKKRRRNTDHSEDPDFRWDPERRRWVPVGAVERSLNQVAQDLNMLAESHKALEQKYVTSMGEIDTVENPAEQIAAAIINQHNRRRAHHG